MFIPFVVVLMTTWVHNVKDDNSSKEVMEITKILKLPYQLKIHDEI